MSYGFWVIAMLITLFGGADIVLKLLTLKELSWFRLTWTPYLNNIANHVNPGHTTPPGDM
jgi:hypothetical protein